MKNFIYIPFLVLCIYQNNASAQSYDAAVDHQEERMVFISWDQGRFDPQPDRHWWSGNIPTNPYWWIIWGIPNPNYHKNDLRPLSATGPETQRLALLGVQKQTDDKYKLHSDTLRNTALSEIAANSGLLSDADPLWLLYYKGQFDPVLNNDILSILSGLSPDVIAELYKENLVEWYTGELNILKERLNALRSTDVDRSSRIMGYFRMLKEYRSLYGKWSNRIAAAKSTILMAKTTQAVKTNVITINLWTPSDDITIANQVINSHY